MPPTVVIALVTVIAVLGVLAFAALTLLKPREQNHPPALPRQTTETSPYRLKNYLLSKAEARFHDTLKQAAHGLQICPKVRLADFLFVAKGTNKRQTAQNQINQKHVDFLLCTEADMRPRLAIELDDKSHNSSTAQKRDAFVNEAYEAAKLPVLRVKAAASYDTDELKQQILDLM